MNNAHYQERKFWIEIDHPRTGPLTYPRLPFIMSETPVSMGRAPLLGEHNEEIYSQHLGYSRQDLAKLREMDVI
jgi:crotonobetainyl-CoA:carnitine CoA-transferase CaiB-like acyl-CoA transferase